MTQLHGMLEALRIERQPLVAANNALIDQYGRPSTAGNGPAIYTHSARKFLILLPVLPGRDSRSGVEEPIATGPSVSDGN